MLKSLRQLESEGLLKLPSATAWGGPFSGMDQLYMGDDSSLVFVGAEGGNSESDERNIILNAWYGTRGLVARMRDVGKKIDKPALIAALNAHVGIQIRQLYTISLEVVATDSNL